MDDKFGVSEIKIVIPQKSEPEIEVSMFEQTMTILMMIKELRVSLWFFNSLFIKIVQPVC